MSDFILDYDILETIAKNSNTISKKANEYADSLTSKVANAINGVSPSSGYLSDASYYVNAKVDQLQQKSREFSDFANQINNLAEIAKRVDEEVAELLAQSKERFLNYHESLRIDDWKARILEWLVDIKNSLPILELIGNVLSSIETILESLADNIKHWYQCEGGKYIFGYIASVALAVVAIALFIGTLPASGFFAICGAIGAGIAALDAVTNIATSWRAVNAAQNGDPAWANIYGKQDKLSDVLRQTNFNNGFLNNLSYFGANTLDATETFCDIAGFAEIGAGIAGWAGKNKGNIKNTLIDLKDSVKKSFSDFKVGGKDNVFGIVDDVDGNVIDNLDININKDVPVIGGVEVPNKLDGDIPKVDADDVLTKPGPRKTKPYANSRPSYGKGQVDQVWENAKDPVTGKVYDPTGVEITWDKSKPRSGQWDMGHIPGEKYSDMHELYMNGTISKEEFLEWYRDPTNYRPELPSTNRGHNYE